MLGSGLSGSTSLGPASGMTSNEKILSSSNLDGVKSGQESVVTSQDILVEKRVVKFAFPYMKLEYERDEEEMTFTSRHNLDKSPDTSNADIPANSRVRRGSLEDYTGPTSALVDEVPEHSKIPPPEFMTGESVKKYYQDCCQSRKMETIPAVLQLLMTHQIPKRFDLTSRLPLVFIITNLDRRKPHQQEFIPAH